MNKTDPSHQNKTEEEKPFLNVIVHSFFIIPFLIAVFCLLLFGSVHLLTKDKKTVYDYLVDISTGSLNKRWQGAFELSKILANADRVPKEQKFIDQMINALKAAEHDDPRIRQYLALAMGRTGYPEFAEELENLTSQSDEEILPALLYSLGMLKSDSSIKVIKNHIDHPDPRTRSMAVVALGNYQDQSTVPFLQKSLNDPEPNVQWGAAVSLAYLGHSSGEDILLQLLNREYLNNFEQIDPEEKTNLIKTAIEASEKLPSNAITNQLDYVSKNDPNFKVRSMAIKVLEKRS